MRRTLLEAALAVPTRITTPAKPDDESVELVWAWMTGKVNGKQVVRATGIKKAALGMYLARTMQHLAVSGEIVPPGWLASKQDDGSGD